MPLNKLISIHCICVVIKEYEKENIGYSYNIKSCFKSYIELYETIK